MTVETLTKTDVETERAQLEREVAAEHGTTDREDLRDLALSGELTFAEIARVERLDSLDYLLGASS